MEKTDWHEVKASSFADPEDIANFKACKARGYSDAYCFRFGDNGVGKWGDDTTLKYPLCALPPDDWRAFENPRCKGVLVEVEGKVITCLLADTMPWKKNIKNGAGIDLNYRACQMLGLKVPLMVKARWRWA
jgi:hypothetical protein